MADAVDDRKWDPLHIQNEEDRYCICGGRWDTQNFMAHCSVCKDWFHEACMDPVPKKLIPGLINYNYVCKRCGGGTETFVRKDGGMAHAENSSTLGFFTAKKDIFPFIERQWDVLWGFSKPRPGSKQWSTIGSTLLNEDQWFQAPAGTSRNTTGSYALVNQNPRWLSPVVHAAMLVDLPTVKRRADDAAGSRRTKRAEGDTPATQTQNPMPFNKDGFRYTLAEKIPNTLESYRPACSAGPVAVSQQDRAPQLRLSDDRLTVTGEKGYCTARASHGVNHGKWYFEVSVRDGERLVDRPDPHVRVGWSQNLSNLQGPCGFDSYSYSWRDLDGSRFHNGKGQPYGSAFGPGDVLGLTIDLPIPSTGLLPKHPEGTLIVWKHMIFYESKDVADKSLLKPAPRATISAFKNGAAQGVMFENIFEGTYYPAVALYMGAQVTFNFGPDFKHAPPAGHRPMSDAQHAQNAGIAMADVLDQVEAKGKK